MAYDNRYIDKYKKYITQGWYSNTISSDILDVWNSNFVSGTKDSNDFDPKICAHYLLNSLIFYQDKHLESIIMGILNKIISNINQNEEQRLGRRLSEEELKLLWDKYKSETCIIPASNPNDVSDSAYQAARLWRNCTGIHTESISQLANIIKSKKHIIFVDDMIGTGKKISNFLNNQMIESSIHTQGNKELYRFINDLNVDIDFSIAVFAIYCEGKKKLEDNYPILKCYYGDYYNEDYNLMSNNCIFFDLFEDNKEYIIKYIKDKISNLDYNEEYVRNLPISFHYGCPNNSLPLYYISSDKWKNLLPESHPDTRKGNAQ